MEVRGRLGEGQLQGVAVGIFVRLRRKAVPSASSGLDARRRAAFSGRFAAAASSAAAAPFGRALDLVGDRAYSPAVSGLMLRMIEYSKRSAFSGVPSLYFRSVAEGEGQLGGVGVVFPLLRRAGDGLQLLVQLGQAFVDQLQVSDFVDEGALLRVDDVGVGARLTRSTFLRARRSGSRRPRPLSRLLLDDLGLDLRHDLGLDDLLLDDLRHDLLDDLAAEGRGRQSRACWR